MVSSISCSVEGGDEAGWSHGGRYGDGEDIKGDKREVRNDERVVGGGGERRNDVSRKGRSRFSVTCAVSASTD